MAHAATCMHVQVQKVKSVKTHSSPPTRMSIHQFTLTAKGTIVYFFFNTHTDSHAQGPESRLAGFDYTWITLQNKPVTNEMMPWLWPCMCMYTVGWVKDENRSKGAKTLWWTRFLIWPLVVYGSSTDMHAPLKFSLHNIPKPVHTCVYHTYGNHPNALVTYTKANRVC